MTGLRFDYCVYFTGFFAVGTAAQVISWTRSFGDGTAVNEFVNINEGDRTVLHSGVDSNITPSHTPVITFHDFTISSPGFSRGLTAVRPLIQDGKRICLLMNAAVSWKKALMSLKKMAWASLSRDVKGPSYVVRRNLPGGQNIGSFPNIVNFCGVNSKATFYLKETASVINYSRKLRVQGLFRRFVIGIPDNLVKDVFG